MAFLGDEKNLAYELILALVSLWLLVDSIKKGKSQRKCPIEMKALQKGIQKVNEMKIKARENKLGPLRVRRMNLKVRFRELTG